MDCATTLNAGFGAGKESGMTLDEFPGLDEWPALSAASLPLQRVLERLNVFQRIELKAIVYVGRGDFASFDEAQQVASEDMDQVSDVAHLMDMAPLAEYLRAGVAKLGIHLQQEGLAGTDVESAAKLALMETAFVAGKRREIQQAADEARYWLLKRELAEIIRKALRKQRRGGE
jgi:hypothetical protein